mmetsp:Transcript_30858/g.78079  ORF Transcript_30858/g.78079 Transcript_30858/m.78079 type:complete len:154 (+) Transcript_30858:1427-1888(+)
MHPHVLQAVPCCNRGGDDSCTVWPQSKPGSVSLKLGSGTTICSQDGCTAPATVRRMESLMCFTHTREHRQAQRNAFLNKLFSRAVHQGERVDARKELPRMLSELGFKVEPNYVAQIYSKDQGRPDVKDRAFLGGVSFLSDPNTKERSVFWHKR